MQVVPYIYILILPLRIFKHLSHLEAMSSTKGVFSFFWRPKIDRKFPFVALLLQKVNEIRRSPGGGSGYIHTVSYKLHPYADICSYSWDLQVGLLVVYPTPRRQLTLCLNCLGDEFLILSPPLTYARSVVEHGVFGETVGGKEEEETEEKEGH